MAKYTALETTTLAPAQIRLNAHRLPELVHLSDPALSVMVDFSQQPALIIEDNTTLETAQHEMEFHGSHFILVCDQDHHLVGVLTATDLLGEKPIQVASDTRITRNDIPVSRLMTPIAEAPAIQLDTLDYARVGHIIKTLHAIDSAYMLVIRVNADETQVIRGYFSTSQISKQLHHNVRRGAYDIDKHLDELSKKNNS